MTPFDAAIELILYVIDSMRMGGEHCPFGLNGWTCPEEVEDENDECDLAACLRMYCEWRAKEGRE